MRSIRPRRGLAVLVAAMLAACTRPPDADPRLVTEWMHTLYGAIRAERISPPVASRLMAYATTALYAGLSAVDPATGQGADSARAGAIAGLLNGLGTLPRADRSVRYDGTLVAIAAERVVLDTLLREAIPATRANVARLADSLRQARVAAHIDEDTEARSTQLGRRIGLALVAWAAEDGFAKTRGRPYVLPAGPGLWVNDAPASTYAAQSVSGATEFVALDNPANVLRAGSVSDRGLILNRPKRLGGGTLLPVNMSGMSEPYWGELRPCVLSRWADCRIPDPLANSADTTSPFYRDASDVYSTKATLTPEQRTIALYWADNAGESGTPVGHWISIASQVVSERRLPAVEAARLTMLTALAQADAFIATWAYKYKFNLIRPRTYLRLVADSTWEPLIPTPPFPEYPSGHSAQSAAAATVLTGVVGDVAFDDSTVVSIGHQVRRFTSFRAAAMEAGQSRVFGGIHFPSGNTNGRALGECVGAKVLERFQIARAP
jgi:membrane-associated phospholipid phosphatase